MRGARLLFGKRRGPSRLTAQNNRANSVRKFELISLLRGEPRAQARPTKKATDFGTLHTVQLHMWRTPHRVGDRLRPIPYLAAVARTRNGENVAAGRGEDRCATRKRRSPHSRYLQRKTAGEVPGFGVQKTNATPLRAKPQKKKINNGKRRTWSEGGDTQN